MLPTLKIDTWEEQPISDLAAEILSLAAKPLILIDGDGGSGKSTVAKHLADILSANLVRTDDVCWQADPWRWDGEMLDGIIRPWLDGENVAYRPSGWVKKNRDGFIEADSSKPLIIEGMGACRKSLRDVASYSVWVDTPPDIARARVIERDLANNVNGRTLESVTAFAAWWDSLVHPFLLAEKPWEHVDIIISGTRSDLNSGKIFFV